MPRIFIDGDGCAVKEETYKVAERYQLKVFIVANKWMSIPIDPRHEMIVVPGNFDAADDWIAENIVEGDIAITADILLAQRIVNKKARAIGPKGIEFTEDSIGDAVATRELMQNLRHMGEMRGGPSPMDKKARSMYLNTLDRVIQAIKRQYKV